MSSYIMSMCLREHPHMHSEKTWILLVQKTLYLFSDFGTKIQENLLTDCEPQTDQIKFFFSLNSGKEVAFNAKSLAKLKS